LVWSIEPSASVYDAIELMAEKGIGALLVMEAGKLVGILSERDYARKIILQGRASKSTAVKEIMTSRVAYTDPEQDIQECMALMTDKRIRHLPVLESGQLCGVVSIGDLVKAIIDEQKFIIEQLERYITH
jgi:CBS domain-containing protein